MKFQEAKALIAKHRHKVTGGGFRVCFQRVAYGWLVGDYFPDRGEEPIKTEDEAWSLAEEFAEATRGTCRNVYVVGLDFRPVTSGKVIINH